VPYGAESEKQYIEADYSYHELCCATRHQL